MPAGQVLELLAAAVQRERITLHRPILVFGSAPLQICVDPSFLSADVDVAIVGQTEIVKRLVESIGMGKGQAAFYIEVVAEYIFRPGPNWRARATLFQHGGVSFLFPAPLDILLAKLRRLEEKDLRAFLLVIQKLDGPTEDELLHELKESYDLFSLQVGGRKSALWENTEKLWPRLYARTINVQMEIIQPVLDAIAAAGATQDYLTELKARLGL